MDEMRFDDLAKNLAARVARRSVLGVLGTTALGALVLRHPAGESLAAKRKRRKKRRKSPCRPRCRGKVCGPDGCSGDCGACDPGEACSEGQCVCAPVCAGKECGPDGCAGQCGTCRAGDTCQGSACVCATAGALGPGDICTSAGQCCPYPDVERFCNRGDDGCPSFLAQCRYGLGGKCFDNCDCEGSLECRGGVCRCPGDRDYLGGGRCCGVGLSLCGDRCCAPGTCLCFPVGGCRCNTPPF
jgi:hypothetical protein